MEEQQKAAYRKDALAKKCERRDEPTQFTNGSYVTEVEVVETGRAENPCGQRNSGPLILIRGAVVGVKSSCPSPRSRLAPALQRNKSSEMSAGSVETLRAPTEEDPTRSGDELGGLSSWTPRSCMADSRVKNSVLNMEVDDSKTHRGTNTERRCSTLRTCMQW